MATPNLHAFEKQHFIWLDGAPFFGRLPKSNPLQMTIGAPPALQ